MLYFLLEWIERVAHPPGFGLVRYLTFRAAAAAVTALLMAFWLGPKIIRTLRDRQIGEAAKVEAPKTHLTKAGTPTMGGLIVLASILVPTLLWGNLTNMYVILILFVTAALGAVGFLDDYLKVIKKKPKGLIARYKIVGQVGVGLVVGSVIYFFPSGLMQTCGSSVHRQRYRSSRTWNLISAGSTSLSWCSSLWRNRTP